MVVPVYIDACQSDPQQQKGHKYKKIQADPQSHTLYFQSCMDLNDS